MASILDKYGIKEVADVVFYEINNDGTHGKPVLYLDTLKVSTIEQTAEQAEARGGKGNPALIAWDYGKEITVTLEDALFSAKSMAIMFSGGSNVTTDDIAITKTMVVDGKDKAALPATTMPDGSTIPTPKNGLWYNENGTSVEYANVASGTKYFYKYTIKPTTKRVIDISANAFPGTYYVTGDTYARSQLTGKDEFFQFIIQKAKVQSENTITLEAEGDPSTFSMNLKVLRPDNGKMMTLVQYSIDGVVEGFAFTDGRILTTESSSDTTYTITVPFQATLANGEDLFFSVDGTEGDSSSHVASGSNIGFTYDDSTGKATIKINYNGSQAASTAAGAYKLEVYTKVSGSKSRTIDYAIINVASAS